MKHTQTAPVYWALLCCLLPTLILAQKAEKIQVKGVYHNGNVLLRWAPTDFSIWQKGNLHGYRVVRQLVAVNGQWVSNSERLASTKTFWGPFKALPEAVWQPMADTSDVAAVAAGAIYSEDFQVVPGGDPTQGAVSANEKNESRFGFGLFAADQSFPVAQAMGLALNDPGAAQNPNATYHYRVILLTPDSLHRPVGYAPVDLRQPLPLPAPAGLEVTMTTGWATLSVPRSDLESHYTSFNIERSEDGGANYVRRNSKPLVFLSDNEFTDHLVFSDTVETENKVYHYRLRGKSPFGMGGPASNVVIVTSPRKKLDVSPNIQTVSEQNGHFVLEWEFPEQYNAELQEFRVLRSAGSEGGFALLPGGTLSAATRQFTDIAPGPLSNYYKVVAVQLGNHQLESIAKLAQLNDTQAPAQPTGLSATVTEKGLVTLIWSPNNEADLKGYRVFWSNQADGDFAQATSTIITSTSFKHQLDLKVLSKKAYFRILATDFRENDSDYSEPLEVSRPDIMRPAKPVLGKAEPQPMGVQLEWIFSQSDDISRHELQRRAEGTQIWTTLASYPQGTNVAGMMDSTTRGVGNYYYRMVAFDAGGLTSSSSIMEVKPVRNNLDMPLNLTVASALDGSQKQAKLSWEYPLADQLREFQIYRALESDAFRLYMTVKVNKVDIVVDPSTNRANFFYRDTDILSGSAYKYQVSAKYEDGSSSAPTKAVPFQY